MVCDTYNGTYDNVPGTSDGTSGMVPGTSKGTSGIVSGTSNGISGIAPGMYATTIQGEEQRTESFFCRVVNEFSVGIIEPTEMPRYVYEEIFSERQSEVTNSSRIIEGETYFITVDRIFWNLHLMN